MTRVTNARALPKAPDTSTGTDAASGKLSGGEVAHSGDGAGDYDDLTSGGAS